MRTCSNSIHAALDAEHKRDPGFEGCCNKNQCGKINGRARRSKRNGELFCGTIKAGTGGEEGSLTGGSGK